MEHSSVVLMSGSGSQRRAPSEYRRVALIGGHGGRNFVESLADRCGGGLIVDVLVSNPTDSDLRRHTVPRADIRTLVVPDVRSISRGDLIARYDAVVYAFESFRERVLPVSGAELPGSVWADDIADETTALGVWNQAVVVGSGERACAAVRNLGRRAERGGTREILVLGGAPRKEQTLVHDLPTGVDGVSVTVCGYDQLVGIRGRSRVEAVVAGALDGSTRRRSAQLVVNATGALPAVLAGLRVNSSGLIANERGRVSATSHEFVLGPLQHLGATAGPNAVSPEMLACRVAERLGDCRSPWSAVDPVQWLEFRHCAGGLSAPVRESALAS
ncbi:hypothetical protein HYG77_23920 [Rhodococcus sp. ZPP]|uniref:hypothetical protein n=1 Tax=Rhodococcus sp. ZPP TaxID=2749906 RepID=UPI001AD89CBD|nr:hypothetical protein [Rhodococcus sp. ZPP]QTJ68321.1 hypothetical protein HYG77_23920 [Rhodococcus sp. ZPP]